MYPLYFFLFLIFVTIPTYAARYAVVIGNGNYPDKSEINDLGPLTNPRNDAVDMGALLQNSGFVLVDDNGNNQPLLDANKGQMDEAVNKLMIKLIEQPGSDVVFYYSGHGVYLQDVARPDESANFLLPVGINFTASNPAKIKGNAVNAHNIKYQIEASSAKLKLMILEACRDKLTLVESHGFDTGEFKPMNPVNGMMVVHATLHSYKSWGNRNMRNSRFTGQLLAALQAGEKQYILQPLSAAIESIQIENAQLDNKYRQYPLLEGTPFGILCLGECGSGGGVVQQPATEPKAIELISGRYQDNGDGTVTDTTTNLMWKRCSEGQTWTGSTCTGEATKFTWNEAMPGGKQKYWETFAGSNKWRMPDRKELKSLVYCSSGQPKTWNDGINGGSVFEYTGCKGFNCSLVNYPYPFNNIQFWIDFDRSHAPAWECQAIKSQYASCAGDSNFLLFVLNLVSKYT